MQHVFSDANELASNAANRIIKILREALDQNERAAFVLTGGETPRMTYEAISRDHRDAIDWNRVDFFWGDDRFVPHDDDESNFRMARETLLSHLDAPDCGVYAVPTHLDSPEEAARAYDVNIRAYFRSNEPRFHLVLFGLGADAHVASLFPGIGELDETERWAVDTRSPEDQPPHERVTMTFPVLNSTDAALFLVAGEQKAEAVEAAFEGDGHLPVHRVNPDGELIWYLDEAAASRVSV